MNRRRFLRSGGALAAVGVASSVAGLACKGEPPVDARRIAQPALQSALGLGAVREIGQQYLNSLPVAQRSATALRAAIANDAAGAGPWPWSPPATLESVIAADFASDMDSGRLVWPGGWVLSVTEARQCALAALAGS